MGLEELRDGMLGGSGDIGRESLVQLISSFQ